MHFNSVVKIIESLPQEYDWLRDRFWSVPVFVFDRPPHEWLPKQLSPEDRESLADHFFLPFPKVVLDDPASLIYLFDLQDQQRGIQSRRGFVEFLPLSDVDNSRYRAPVDEFEQGLMRYSAANQMLPDNTFAVSVGQIEVGNWTETGWELSGSVEYTGAAAPGQAIAPLTKPEMKFGELEARKIHESCLSNAMTSLEEVMNLNSRSRFVVEVTPKKQKSNPKKIPRTHQRKLYTFLTIGEIQKRTGLAKPKGTGSSKSPHYRRRHTRVLRSDRFTKSQGKEVTVEAAWVGSTEAQVGNKFYKVRLDI